ncbi:glycerol kinase [Leptothrix cholodnii SP-6]|uniref:Glycerol kinase n=1 Tax=Leptothrix cholodnii (strain ATCC 51168 / LMG 8142 / SP-6) TaxID=395495 RepID=GLPK_LEPCP|nr:glycerol kinase GlpK [Leptothrix cholodnii]B1Y1L9.1 RecName: Full=Glycerol kinase; AltName: Full=ATP:glycerol 3-phosphotransferase; AltName: Full=Glycerokinase; Short=GK [Leptothrix cholodnii SP-6]ACB35481.1 glycerol kinase [Leptothrix cholodnii SP-6]
MSFLLALDQGTSSSRSIVFDIEGRPVAMAQRELRQIYPQPGWVEHDPIEIRDSQLATAREAIARAGISAHDIRAVGITNQRETTLLWNRRTGAPLHNAIVWQDRRTEPICAALRERGAEALVRQRTGLLIDPYFSGTKLQWLLDHVPGAREQAARGELAFGTVDAWLVWQLTGGRVHATDVTNASRTLLFDVHANRWDDELLSLLDVPHELLPAVFPSSHLYGETDAGLLGAALPIAGIAGDQQSALFGQACFKPGLAKNTYGTGCFLLMHNGDRFQSSANGLVTTAAAQTGPQPQFAIEGSVFVGGAVVQWLRDGLRAIDSASAVQALAQSVPDSGGVVFVPAFTGLGAPYWKPDARGAIVGLSRGTTLGHIARAALESIAYQSAALLAAMGRDAQACGGAAVTELRVDGGACVNDLLMQFQADLLGVPVVRPQVIETTARGAAFLAGLSTGVYRGLDELEALWQPERTFHPTLPPGRASELMAQWEHAVRQTVAS